jgi:acyl carrier protein
MSADRVLSLADLVALLEEATQALPGAIAADTELAGVDGWDSMGMVVFMGLVKERTGIELRVHELGACADARAVLDLVGGAEAA